jgi:hypothetical protein
MQAELVNWENSLPEEHWSAYKCVLAKVCNARIPFALGGGLALSVYTQKFRQSKDVDLYVLPQDRDKVIEIVGSCGLKDYYDVKEYVRHWIYRAHSDDAIVDVIWAMANHRAEVDDWWVTAGPKIRMFGHDIRVVPVEELIWSKLYVLQRDRCDWPDIVNLMNAIAGTLDWDHLLERTGEDSPLLKAVISVFSWVCPARAMSIPRRIWDQLGLAPDFECHLEDRPSPKDLLDTRPWLFDACAA